MSSPTTPNPSVAAVSMDPEDYLASPPHTRSASIPSLHSGAAKEGEATVVGGRAVATIPTYTTPTRKKSKRKLGKGMRPRVEKGIDPYDYEQKFPEDEKFKEMGPMARVWKTFLEEYGKFDSDMVEDWRDALDVLLVFAGLFSAVVSTFVAQSSQALQVDFAEVTANLMFEVAHLQRAMLNGATSDEGIAHSALSPDTPVRVSSTSSFVNALWFASLALSLTTALLAVLTKQWIHQYLATSSGTPRDRCRTRQFRYENLKEWHVPLIIGMLPVLMHVALGLFFAGLVVFVRSLSTPIAIVVGAIAFFAFVSYFGTNLLPLFRPACPYKTYLTRYSYSMIGCIQAASRDITHYFRCHLQLSASLDRLLPRTIMRNSTRTAQDIHPPRSGPHEAVQSVVQKSFSVVEKELVHQIGDELDARALSGLHNISSNTSVQSIVLQALSIMPLQSLDTIRARIFDLEGIIRGFLDSEEYMAEAKRSAYERLYRAHVRVWATADHSDTAGRLSLRNSLAVAPVDVSEDSIATLVDRTEPEHAVKFLRQQIVDPTVCYDVFSWAAILQNALRNGPHWLDVDCKESPVWMTLADWLIRPHFCLENTICDINNYCSNRASLPIGDFHLIVREHPHYPGSQPTTFDWLVISVLRPTICEYLVRTLYPAHQDDADLPHDTLLNLALVQLPSVQSTSGSADGTPLLHNAIRCIRRYVGVDINPALRRHNIHRAAFRSLVVVLCSDAFLGDVIVHSDKIGILHALFRTLVKDSTLAHKLLAKLSDTVIQTISDVVFLDFPTSSESIQIVAEILHIDWHSELNGSTSNALVREICRQLHDRDWLGVVHAQIAVPLFSGASSESSLFHLCFSYALLASAYVDSMQASFSAEPELYNEMMSYISIEDHATSVCLMLIIGGVLGASRLSIFCRFMEPSLWMAVRQKLLDALQAETGRDLYNRYSKSYSGKRNDVAGISDLPLAYHSYEELVLIITETAEVVAGETTSAHTPHEKVSSEPSTSSTTVYPRRSVHRWIRGILTRKQPDDLERGGSYSKDIL